MTSSYGAVASLAMMTPFLRASTWWTPDVEVQVTVNFGCLGALLSTVTSVITGGAASCLTNGSVTCVLLPHRSFTSTDTLCGPYGIVGSSVTVLEVAVRFRNSAPSR